MEWFLPVIWAALIGTAVALYVILDGFDLGMGILFPTMKSESERDQAMTTIGPFWDGNETWLVLGGGGLFVAFPHAYGIIMPALYLPVIIMLLALVFRGVAFEFRNVSRSKVWWNRAFTLGSTIAAFFQGVILAGLIQGIKVENREFVGGAFDWMTPFALLCGLGVIAGYGLLGATWLVMKAEGPIADRARAQGKFLVGVVLLFMAAVSLWTAYAFPRITDRWFSLPNFFYLLPIPIITALVAALVWRALEAGRDGTPFVATIMLFLLGYLGLVISSYPFLVPPSVTIWDAAAAPDSQIFMLIGTLVFLPLALCYTALLYWLFRGKVKPGESYHH
jgi:cytochrome d ubiquinol oxidase subunit II